MTKIILNFTRVAQGGGVQNSLSFIENLKKIDELAKYVLIARKKSIILDKALEEGYDSIGVNEYKMDFFCRKHFSREQVCFTFFGPPWLTSVDYLINVCGVAYSNLFYPEIDFWKGFSGAEKVKRNLKDFLRFFNLRFSDFWIFETESLAQRANFIAGFPEDRVGVVRMSPSSLVSPEKIKETWASEFEDYLTPGSFRLLFLASDNPNKRIIKIAPILKKILEEFNPNISIEVVTTLNLDCEYFKKIYCEFKKFGIENCWVNIGPVSYEKVSSLISVSSCMCLFSVLESFSNNMVEAWRMGIPFVVTDSDWSKSEAGDAAVYIDPEDEVSAAEKLWRLIIDKTNQNEIIAKGYAQLSLFPNSEQKTDRYLYFLNLAKNKGFIGKDRSKIKYFLN